MEPRQVFTGFKSGVILLSVCALTFLIPDNNVANALFNGESLIGSGLDFFEDEQFDNHEFETTDLEGSELRNNERMLQEDFGHGSNLTNYKHNPNLPRVTPFGHPQWWINNERRKKCILELRDEYRRIIGSLFQGKHAILVDTVDHGNLGDSFIQVGEMKLMDELHSHPRHACSVTKCNFTLLKEEIKEYNDNAVVLVHGGGNIGDFWRFMSLFKNRLTVIFRDYPLVFLPQSIRYANEELADKDGVVFAQHKNLTIVLRDQDSLDFARKHFIGTRSILSPDGAFMIGPIDKSSCIPRYDVFFLSRSDLERRKDVGSVSLAREALERANLTTAETDWFSWRRFFESRPMPSNRLEWAYWRLELGTKLLCKGRIVISDRLHAVLLSTLMGIPHIFLDNSSRKIQAYREANFRTRESCKDDYVRGWHAANWMEAAQLAGQLFDKKVFDD